MNHLPFALYDAFSEHVFGGSQAAIVSDAGTIGIGQRQRIAREFGMPATVFIDDFGHDWVTAQFMSTVMELPMCGHGTICLMTHMLESEFINLDSHESRVIELRLPTGVANVTLSQRQDKRFQIMLDIKPPRFKPGPGDTEWLSDTLGITLDDLASDLPLEIASGDFIHMVVPLKGLAAMRSITPNFNNMVEFCNRHGIETIAVFCREVENAMSTIHVRDFCPAVGVNESAGAGTTNAALTSYLIRHKIVHANINREVVVHAEQGIEIERPSSILSIATVRHDKITHLKVGGVATRVMDGQVYL